MSEEFLLDYLAKKYNGTVSVFKLIRDLLSESYYKDWQYSMKEVAGKLIPIFSPTLWEDLEALLKRGLIKVEGDKIIINRDAKTRRSTLQRRSLPSSPNPSS